MLYILVALGSFALAFVICFLSFTRAYFEYTDRIDELYFDMYTHYLEKVRRNISGGA